MNSGSVIALGAAAIGGYFLYENYFATPATPAATPAPGTTTAPPTTTAAPPAANSSAVCSGTLAAVAASGDPNFTASGADFLGQPYHWQVYWNLQPVAPALNIGAMYPDATVMVTGAAFCAAAQAYLTAQGLAGYMMGMGDDSDSSSSNLIWYGLAAAGVWLAFSIANRGSSKTRGQY
jgi:hypothetical protein